MSKAQKQTLNIGELYSKFGIFLILLLAVIIASFLSDAFLSSRNLMNILRQNAVITIIACGAQMVLICGDVDLSAGSVTAFSGCIAAMTMVRTQSIALAILAGLASGASIGFLNGLVVTKCAIPAFIMTLATQRIARGGILAITNAQPIPSLGNFAKIGQGYLGPIPVPVVILIVILAITWLIMNRLPYGRYMYAVGGNKEAAKASGINVDSVRTRAFTFQGLMAGLGGIMLMARLNSGQPTGAEAYEFQAITAVIIGGTSMSGGVGNIYGTIAGAFFVGVLINIMTLMDVSAYYQEIVQGAIIAFAVIIDVSVRGLKKK